MSQRRAVVGIAIAASTLMLGACGFQSPAVTDGEHNSVQGHDFSVGPIRIRDAFVTTEISSSGPKAYVIATIINNGTAKDSLTGITSTDGTITVTGLGVFDGSLPIPPKGAPVNLQQPIADPAGPAAVIAAATVPGAGTFVPLTFSFGSAGTSTSEQIPVVPSTETTSVSSPVPTTHATPPSQPGDSAND